MIYYSLVGLTIISVSLLVLVVCEVNEISCYGERAVLKCALVLNQPLAKKQVFVSVHVAVCEYPQWVKPCLNEMYACCCGHPLCAWHQFSPINNLMNGPWTGAGVALLASQQPASTIGNGSYWQWGVLAGTKGDLMKYGCAFMINEISATLPWSQRDLGLGGILGFVLRCCGECGCC